METQQLPTTTIVENKTLDVESLYKRLRQIENNAYGYIIKAFCAEGELTWEKQNIIDQLKIIFHITEERHRLELKKNEENQIIKNISQNCKDLVLKFQKKKFLKKKKLIKKL
jgi:phosphoenolpyruvate synthase/pyruvate phosphate dikinase